MHVHGCPQALELSDTRVPFGALHALTGLQRLQRLALDLSRCLHLTKDDLVATLALLCRGMPSLSSIVVRTSSFELDAGACVQRVQGQLGRWGIVPAPTIRVTRANGSDSDSDSDDSDSDSDSDDSGTDSNDD